MYTLIGEVRAASAARPGPSAALFIARGLLPEPCTATATIEGGQNGNQGSVTGNNGSTLANGDGQRFCGRRQRHGSNPRELHVRLLGDPDPGPFVSAAALSRITTGTPFRVYSARLQT